MSAKPRNRASLDADAVARMMREQDEPAAVAAPEVAPPPPPAPEPRMLAPASEPEFDPGKVDGRTLRRTGREPFATRIKPETHEALRRIAYGRKITIAEALEMAVAAYDGR
jgi:hypothetical protein